VRLLLSTTSKQRGRVCQSGARWRSTSCGGSQSGFCSLADVKTRPSPPAVRCLAQGPEAASASAQWSVPANSRTGPWTQTTGIEHANKNASPAHEAGVMASDAQDQSLPTLFLVDALSIVYRSYYAFQKNPLYSSSGINTSAIYGFIQTILLLLQKYNPEALAVVFDSHTTEPGPGSFRQLLFPKYKANRERMPDGVRDALPYVKRAIHQLGLQSFELESFEADDVIGTLAALANHNGYRVVIVSNDKDFKQLIKAGWVRLLRPTRSSGSGGFDEVTEADLAAECGTSIRPQQYPDVLALAGDAVDNIPGVPGIGIKTAARLIRQFSSIEDLLCNLDAIEPSRIQEKIISKADELLRNKVLAKIHQNVPLEKLQSERSPSADAGNELVTDAPAYDAMWIASCRRGPWQLNALLTLLRELDMEALSRRIQYLARSLGQSDHEKRTSASARDMLETGFMAAPRERLDSPLANDEVINQPLASEQEIPPDSQHNNLHDHVDDRLQPAAGSARDVPFTSVTDDSATAVPGSAQESTRSMSAQSAELRPNSASVPANWSADELSMYLGAPLRYQIMEADALLHFLDGSGTHEPIGLFMAHVMPETRRRPRHRTKEAAAAPADAVNTVRLSPNSADATATTTTTTTTNTLTTAATAAVAEHPLILMGIATDQGNAAGAVLPATAPWLDTWLRQLRERLDQAHQRHVGFDLKHVLRFLLARDDIRADGVWIDPAVAHALLYPEEAFERPELLAKRYLGDLGAALWNRYVEAPLTSASTSETRTEALALAAAFQADLARHIFHRQVTRLDAVGMRALAFQVEFPLTLVLVDMERTGVYVAQQELRELEGKMERELRDIETQIYALAGTTFNIRSADQLARVLFEQLGVDAPLRTPGGKASTADRVLAALVRRYGQEGERGTAALVGASPREHGAEASAIDASKASRAASIAALTQEYRQIAKLLSTYVRGLVGHIDPKTQRIHATFHQTGAITGRLSSSAPNLQSIPIRSTRGRALRSLFRATPIDTVHRAGGTEPAGNVLISADYEQIELRIIGALSGDAVLLQAFRDQVDVHATTARHLFGLPFDAKVSAAQRTAAKAINYGIPYGVTAYGLAQNLRISVAEARKLIREYHDAFPGVARLKRELLDKARATGYASTLLGRRRYLPALHSRNYAERTAAERAAVNMPIQGSQADMIKVAMVRIWQALRSQHLRTRIVIQIHDELVFEAPESELASVMPLIQVQMERALILPNDVPVKVRIGYGVSWAAAHAP